jgi:hypothetical protein
MHECGKGWDKKAMEHHKNMHHMAMHHAPVHHHPECKKEMMMKGQAC